MEEKKLTVNVSSALVEKGIDAATGFLDKLIGPSVAEVGLLIKDHISSWRFNNEIRMLVKAKAVCEENGINPKHVSLKLVAPLLDYAGMEEDETLKDKWAILLSNLVDSEQNIENHVFPYILSQLSLNEFSILENIYDDRLVAIDKSVEELKVLVADRIVQEEQLNCEIEKIEKEIVERFGSEKKYIVDKAWWDLRNKKEELKSKLSALASKQRWKEYEIAAPAYLEEDILKPFELQNIMRLGLVKETQHVSAHSSPLEIPTTQEWERQSYTRVDVEITTESVTEFTLTELGALFMDACKEKKHKKKTTSSQ